MTVKYKIIESKIKGLYAVRNTLPLSRLTLIELAILLIVTGGTVAAIPYHVHQIETKKHKVQLEISSKPAENCNSTTIVIPGVKSCSSIPKSAVSSATATPAPTTANPASESQPSLAAEQQENAKLCAQAQSMYDQVSTNTEQSVRTGIEGIQNEGSNESLSQIVVQENQVYANANSTLQEEYDGYLKTVNAVPGCAVDFQQASYTLSPIPSE